MSLSFGLGGSFAAGFIALGGALVSGTVTMVSLTLDGGGLTDSEKLLWLSFWRLVGREDVPVEVVENVCSTFSARLRRSEPVQPFFSASQLDEGATEAIS